ncbi:hypothetical protein Pse7367_3225 [Thalassoporum mexicanum PCC 7367]|uniref:hypothetical protein n=1 Tax=Thalassoporum mexicanum TaxID=3457544 RepID=UPI00029FD128|nr:hypothetical protein [Pseudanabaena sp. PCC 7367]AFY71470.1 hypothetical protein Pse7367_3225 [Pseudanabaena sp. PCC 7367]
MLIWLIIAAIVIFVFVSKRGGFRRVFSNSSLGNIPGLGNLSKNAKNNSLKRELMTLVHGQSDVANRLLRHARDRHPGKTEQWYLEKVIYDLRRR